MDKKIIIVAVAIILIIIGVGLALYHPNHWENELGHVDKNIYGNENSSNVIVVITGMHPRETLAIEPEIEAINEFVKNHDDVCVINYAVTVTKNPTDYQEGRDNGESLVHDFVVPDICRTNAKAVIISHSHIEGYGEGFYLATPAMDAPSVSIAESINATTNFNYFTSDPDNLVASSAILISKPLADAGYPTFVYEIPEDITEQYSTYKTVELLELIYDLIQ